MKRFYFSILACFLFSSAYSQDFSIYGGYSAEQLVDIILADGIEYSNVVATGFSEGQAYFEGQSNMDLNSGIILSSGNAFLAIGPNNTGSAGYDCGNPGDPDLTILAGISTYDASILEFDFNSGSETILSVNFCFGSEEYPEYVGSNVNDVIGIFISGPGINGIFSNSAVNLALVPLTNPPEYAGINTINTSSNPEYYISNEEDYIQYDGLTTRIVGSQVLIPNETYHLKIALADGGDGIYDTGLFIEEDGIKTQQVALADSAIITHVACYGDSTGQIETAVSGIYPPFNYAWSNGDTTALIDSLAAGIYSVTITDANMNSISETFEVEQAASALSCFYQYTYFQDPCQTEVTAIVEGGAPPYTFEWHDTALISTNQTAILCPGYYLLIVSDTLGCIHSDSVLVSLAPYAPLQVEFLTGPQECVANISPDGLNCSNVEFSGSSYAQGSFSGSSNIGFDKGIILCTGYSWLAEGPNSSDSSGVFLNLPGDSDLDIISGTATYDAAILEFDFVSENESIDFYYVFASEEYNEVVDDPEPDVIGFFISGPGINGAFSNGAKNFAVLPEGSSQENITVNTVNNGFALPGEIPNGPCYNCDFYIFNTEQSLGYDGFTTIQNIHLEVETGALYHAKIAIADAGNRNYDSGILLKAVDGNFTGTMQFEITAQNGQYEISFNNNILRIEPENTSQKYSYKIMDISGRVQMEKSVIGNQQINCNVLAPGINVIVVQDAKCQLSKKFLIN
jgi:SprB repeat